MKIYDITCEGFTNPLGIDTASPSFSWKLQSELGELWQKAYKILVASSPELIKKDYADIWNSHIVYSPQTVNHIYTGEPLQSFSTYYCLIEVLDDKDCWHKSSISTFETAILDKKLWNAKWIGHANSKKSRKSSSVGEPSPYLKRVFSITKEIRKAKIYVTALGVYKLCLNNSWIGEDYLTPGWTDYNVRLEYQSYDITEHIKLGNNVLGAILGDGWYCGNLANIGRNYYSNYPLKFFAKLVIEYIDGSSESINTDELWKSKLGPIEYSDIQIGEKYDSRKQLADWMDSETNSSWSFVDVFSTPNITLKSNISLPIRKEMDLMPISVATTSLGTFIFDFGQNLVGHCKIRVTSPEGTEISISHAEMLNSDGTLYLDNLRGATQKDIYICNGSGEEIYEPLFTYHGFRYVEIAGSTNSLNVYNITASVIHSELKITGKFQSSNEIVNKLYSNIFWGQRGNFLSIPTDCPQRDERLGWTGDSVNFCRTGLYNMNCKNFYTKYMQDIIDAQSEDGAYSDVAPHVEPFERGNGAWGDAGIFIPYYIYKYYGDSSILKKSFFSMENWIEYLINNSKHFIRPEFTYGDWLSVDEDTPSELVNTAYFAYSTSLMIEVSEILGYADKSEYYKTLFTNIKNAFINKFVSPTGIVGSGSQCSYVQALAFNLLPKELKPIASKKLVDNINLKGIHINTGFTSIAFILPVLCDNGYVDIAYKLITNETYPSWGYSIVNGATTIWERWNSFTHSDGFGDPSMNSFNHYSLGSAGEWLYKYCLGIDISHDKYGHGKIKIQPFINKAFSYAQGEYDSIYGTIKTFWKYKNDNIYLKVTIPTNCYAELILPSKTSSVIELTGGTYEFNIESTTL